MPTANPPRPSRIVYLVKRAETVVRSGLEACLQPLAVTPRQYITLSLLHGEHDQSSAELARKAGITPQSMTDTIATLIARGLIEREESPGHRRILMTRLTGAGDALLTRCEAAVDAMETALLSDLPAGDVDALRSLLRAIIRRHDLLKAPSPIPSP